MSPLRDCFSQKQNQKKNLLWTGPMIWLENKLFSFYFYFFFLRPVLAEPLFWGVIKHGLKFRQGGLIETLFFFPENQKGPQKDPLHPTPSEVLRVLKKNFILSPPSVKRKLLETISGKIFFFRTKGNWCFYNKGPGKEILKILFILKVK